MDDKRKCDSFSEDDLLLFAYGEKKDPTLLAIGKGGELENRRIDLIIPDDMITLKAAEPIWLRSADNPKSAARLNCPVPSCGERNADCSAVGSPPPCRRLRNELKAFDAP